MQQKTGQTTCAYCGVSLVDDYYHWLLMAIDHVVPLGEARRLGIKAEFAGDIVNIVLSCSGCNGFRNRYTVKREPKPEWTLEEFIALRDEVFAERARGIEERRKQEIALYQRKLWENR